MRRFETTSFMLTKKCLIFASYIAQVLQCSIKSQHMPGSELGHRDEGLER